MKKHINPLEKLMIQNFTTCCKIRHPVLLEQLIINWPALDSWDIEYLQSKYGDIIIPIEYFTNEYFRPSKIINIKFSEYLTTLKTATKRPSIYLSELELTKYFPELLSDIRTPAFLPPTVKLHHKLFFGYASIASAHYHAVRQALLCQIIGNKKVYLIHPRYFYRLSPEPWYSTSFNFSKINFSNEQQLEKYKKYFIEVNLKPGDALFIPINWWHLVIGEQLSLSLTFFWDATFTWEDFTIPWLRSKFGILNTRLRQVF